MGSENKNTWLFDIVRLTFEFGGVAAGFFGIYFGVAGTVVYQEYMNAFGIDPAQFPAGVYQTMYYGAKYGIDSLQAITNWIFYLCNILLSAIVVGFLLYFFRTKFVLWMGWNKPGKPAPLIRIDDSLKHTFNQFIQIIKPLVALLVLDLLLASITVQLIGIPHLDIQRHIKNLKEFNSPSNISIITVTRKNPNGPDSKSLTGLQVASNDKFYAIYDYSVRMTRIIAVGDVDQATIIKARQEP